MNDESPRLDGELVERVDKSKLIPLNNANCKHELVPDDDQIGDFVSMRCKHCPLGWFFTKEQAGMVLTSRS